MPDGHLTARLSSAVIRRPRRRPPAAPARRLPLGGLAVPGHGRDRARSPRACWCASAVRSATRRCASPMPASPCWPRRCNATGPGATPHELLVERVAREMTRAGRIAWRGLGAAGEGRGAAGRWPCPTSSRSATPRSRPTSSRSSTRSRCGAPTCSPTCAATTKRAGYLQLGGECWYVIRAGIAEPGEIPPECGVLVAGDGGLDRGARPRRGGRCGCAFRSGWRLPGRRRSKAGGSKMRRPGSATTAGRTTARPPRATRRGLTDAAVGRRHPRRACGRGRAEIARRDRRARRALWVALLLIVIWGANFTVQKAIFQALSPGGFLFVRYLIMPVGAAAAAVLAVRPELAARLARRCPAAASPRPGRPPAARRPGDLRHPLVDRVLELADPGLRAGLHAASSCTGTASRS